MDWIGDMSILEIVSAGASILLGVLSIGLAGYVLYLQRWSVAMKVHGVCYPILNYSSSGYRYSVTLENKTLSNLTIAKVDLLLDNNRQTVYKSQSHEDSYYILDPGKVHLIEKEFSHRVVPIGNYSNILVIVTLVSGKKRDLLYLGNRLKGEPKECFLPSHSLKLFNGKQKIINSDWVVYFVLCNHEDINKRGNGFILGDGLVVWEDNFMPPRSISIASLRAMDIEEITESIKKIFIEEFQEFIVVKPNPYYRKHEKSIRR